jgi:hypothetical protein
MDKQYQIIAEAIMTSGPRKFDDTGLGEDACGLFLSNGYCAFWIADGASESPVLTDRNLDLTFSTRALAQDLCLCLREHILANIDGLGEMLYRKEPIVEQVLRGCLETVLTRWNDRLHRIVCTNLAVLDQAFADPLSNTKDFSSTFLCGFIDTTGHMQIACYGDSPVVVRCRDNVYTVCRPEPYRFFLRLRKQNDAYDDFVSSNQFKIRSEAYDNVSLVIAGSDGVGKLPEFIQAQGGMFSFAEIRSRLHRFDPRTADDKTLCIISLEKY